MATNVGGAPGAIVGACQVQGQLYYEDRPQGPTLYGDDEAAVLEQARAYRARCLAQPGAEDIWRDPEAWTLRLRP